MMNKYLFVAAVLGMVGATTAAVADGHKYVHAASATTAATASTTSSPSWSLPQGWPHTPRY